MKAIVILALLIVGCNGEQQENIHKQIVSGYEAGACEHPHMAYLLLKMKDGSSSACAGSLIDPHHILTAAHCLIDVVSLTAYLGHANTRKSSQIIKGSSWAYHGHYSMGRSVINDVGMIRLKTPAKLGRCVKTISLPRKDQVFTGSCIIPGWGQLSNYEDTTTHLRMTTMKIIPTRECKKYAPQIFQKQHICLGDNTRMGNNFCSGDSGGPLMCKSGNKYIVAGVASYSFDCNTGFGVYANVAGLLDWVKKAQRHL